MSHNTSATGGYLSPSLAMSQTALEDELHALIAGITQLPANLVRPRWQPDPPRVPDQDVNWCAFGITLFDPQNFAEVRHHGHGDGRDELVEYEDMNLLASFYGPGHLDLARQLKAGMHIPQNRAKLRPAGIAFIKAGAVTHLPEAVALQWRARADLPLHFRLETRRFYAVLNILKVQGGLNADKANCPAVPFGCKSCGRCDLTKNRR